MEVCLMAVEVRDVMTAEQVAEYMQLDPADVQRLIAERGLPALEVSEGVWRIPRAALDEWLNRAARARNPERQISAREAMHRADRLREDILRRRSGMPLPRGFAVEAIREVREGD
jgi:excisionase family DNA binding protein